jgi:hypothetical protein
LQPGLGRGKNSSVSASLTPFFHNACIPPCDLLPPPLSAPGSGLGRRKRVDQAAEGAAGLQAVPTLRQDGPGEGERGGARREMRERENQRQRQRQRELGRQRDRKKERRESRERREKHPSLPRSFPLPHYLAPTRPLSPHLPPLIITSLQSATRHDRE